MATFSTLIAKISLAKWCKVVVIGKSIFLICMIQFVFAYSIRAETFNFIVPSEVLLDFSRADPAAKRKYCSSSNQSAKREIKRYLTEYPVPEKIVGYNSRMDNEQDVEFARLTGRFVLRLSEVMTDAWASNTHEDKELALNALTRWAENNALLQTKSCTRNGRLTEGCTEWKQRDGQDLSDSKDFSTVQMWVMKLANGYYFTLADYLRNDPRHTKITKWFGDFFDRNKKPSKVYFGLDHGWYWPKILDLHRRGKDPTKLVQKLIEHLDTQVLDDGALKDRTTRGNKALWYHHSAMHETMVSLEVARRFGVSIPKDLDRRIELAGSLFINGYRDNAFMDKWAKVAHNGVYEQGKQDFRNTIDKMPNGHSWFYIYAYRYPDSTLTTALEDMLSGAFRQAVKEGMVGFGLGCIYAAAKTGHSK